MHTMTSEGVYIKVNGGKVGVWWEGEDVVMRQCLYQKRWAIDSDVFVNNNWLTTAFYTGNSLFMRIIRIVYPGVR